MDPIARQTALAAAGAAGEATYVDDVFSTFLYDGNGSTSHSINNGIDLSGEGGMVWFGRRDSGAYKPLFDTERGATKALYSNDPLGEDTASTDLTAFNSNGFTVAQGATVNANGGDYVSWTFRKAPGFFDVVTYTGNGSNRTIAHSLGSVPGSIWVKRTDASGDWQVYHRSLANTEYMVLNSTAAKATGTTRWNSTTPTSSVFSLGTDTTVNASGGTYVAYVFAHDDQSFGTNADESIIKCGSLTISSQATVEVNLGFESQFVLLKRSDGTANWFMFDTMRGMAMNSVEWLHPNLTSAAEAKTYQAVYPTPTGFGFNPANNGQLVDGTYIYIAIRRPHKPPTAGTEVFDIDAFAGSGSAPVLNTGFPVDLTYTGWRDRSYVAVIVDRKHPTEFYPTISGGSNSTSTGIKFDLMDSVGITSYAGDTGYNVVNYSFRRAPGFFDIASFTPTSTNAALNVNHDLGVEPELMLVKQYGIADNWYVYHEHLGGTHTLKLNLADAASDVSNIWADTDPTASVFTVGTEFTDTFLFCRAYLFATLAGVSKVGTYSGTGNAINVDCGFTAGARFVMIKRSDGTGDWYVWDTARGIVSGNDEYLLVNENGLSVTTNTDYIDPLNSGFTVTSSAPAALNASGGTYIFFAIA